MDAAGAAMDEQWHIEGRIDPALLRVRCGERTRWFALVGSDEVGESESQTWPDVRGACVGGHAGLLVARCEGGLLEQGLRRRGGMPASWALGVLDEVLELLEAAPAAPPGLTRAAIRCFGVDRRGAVVLIPGRFGHRAERSDTAELGELLHLALTGVTWEETGLPLRETAPDVPDTVSALVTDLLDGSVVVDSTGRRAGLVELRGRIATLGPSRDRGFLPAEPGVREEDAPTGTLSPDVVVALRGSPRSSIPAQVRLPAQARTPAQAQTPDSVPSPAARARTRTSARTRRGRVRAERGRRRRVLSTGVLLACVVCAASGAVLMATGAGEAEVSAGAGAETSPHAPVQPPDPAPEPPTGPLDAAVELTRARAAAFEAGDPEALAAVTVPGSPAAAADADRALEDCADCAEALSLSDVRVIPDPEAPTADGGTSDREAQPPEAGQRAHVHATMRSAGAAPLPVLLVLEFHDDRWRVHEVHPG